MLDRELVYNGEDYIIKEKLELSEGEKIKCSSEEQQEACPGLINPQQLMSILLVLLMCLEKAAPMLSKRGPL